MEEKENPELRATLDLIMNHMKQIEGQITTLKEQGYITDKHEATLVLTLYNVGDMVASCIECETITKALEELRGKVIEMVMKNAPGYMGKGEKHG